MQKSSKKEFSQLIEKHQGIIHKITMFYASNTNDREDLFQEICLQLWKSYPNFRHEAKFSTWMYRVALNTAIGNIRKNKDIPGFVQLSGNDKVADDRTEEIEQVKLLYQSISKLNRIDKAIILLWLEEKSYDEIATIIGITTSNVGVKLVRIKQKLEALVAKSERTAL
ncbi:MAG TPA: sigma-70 family RNA polymerase sigma factor [Draconibacterium sp.]|nr:sigma-70 family RNA polymerase sigma factor [Draconibacterium sp.]